MKSYSFSPLQKALLAVSSCSYLSMHLGWAHAAEGSAVAQLDTITMSAQPEVQVDNSLVVDWAGFRQQNLATVPASIGVVTAQLIADQQAKTLNEVVKNDASVGESYAPIGYYANFMMRGFSLNAGSSYLLNGHLLRGEQNVALENKAQVEILKGITAIQSGMSTPGGVVNYVSKRPEVVKALTIAGDNEGGRRIAGDIGDWFGNQQQFGYRINVAYEELKPYVEHADGTRLFGALAFDWMVSESAKIEFDLEAQQQEQRSVPGYQLLGGDTVPTGIKWDRLLGYQNWSKPVNQQSLNARLAYQHQINADWNSYISASQSRVVVDDYSAFAYTFDSAGNYDIYDFRSPDDSYLTHQFKTGLNGSFDTAAWQHHLNLELSHQYKKHTQYDAINEKVGSGSIYADPMTYSPTDQVLGNYYTSLKSQQTALHLLDQVEFNETWSVLLGGKLLHLNEKAYSADGNRIRDTRLNRFLPQLAVMYQPGQNTHLYASYAQGISDGSQAPWTAYGNPEKGIVGNAFETLAPRRSTQYELGIKHQWQELLLTAALFDLTQDYQYTNIDQYYVSEGQQHNLGLELGLQGHIAPHLEINSSLALIRSRLEHIQLQSDQGHQTQNVPLMRLSSHVAYEVSQFEGLRLLAGMQYSSNKFANKMGTVKVPSYTIFDLGAAYNMRAYGYEHIFRLNVDNVFNQKYWRDAGSFFGDNYLFLGTPRTANFSWSINF